MKRVSMVLVVLIFLGLATNVMAVVSTNMIDSSKTSLTVRLIGIATPDTLDSYTLDYWPTVGGHSQRWSGSNTIPTAYAQGDTCIITGLYNGTSYSWTFNYVTRTGTGGATKTYSTITGIDTTTAINQVITVGATDSLGVDSVRYNVRIVDTWYTADSTLLKIGLQYKKASATTWTLAPVRAVYGGSAIGRDSVGLGSPDTLMAFSPLRVATTGTAINLEPGELYNFRVLGYCLANTQNVADTSNTLSYTAPALLGYKNSYYDIYGPTGYLGDDEWHYYWPFTKTGQNYKTDKIPISEYMFLRVQYKLLGWDNNQTADSISLYMNTDRSGVMIRVDSLFHRDIDTTAWTDVWLKTGYAGAIADSVECKARDYGGYLQFEGDCTDTSVAVWADSTIDLRVLDVRIIGGRSR